MAGYPSAPGSGSATPASASATPAPAVTPGPNHGRRHGSSSSTYSGGGGGGGGGGSGGGSAGGGMPGGPPDPRASDGRQSARNSGASTSGTPTNPSHVESSITRLLVATKQLLESLTHWSHGRLDEGGVSDVYVQLGNDFNAASLTFTREGIDMRDLNSVPDDLRECLEAALSEEATPATLDQHLPRIRQIVVQLLHGLKTKQTRWRNLQAARKQEEANARASLAPSAPNRDSGPPDRPMGGGSVVGSRAARTLSAAKSRDDLRRAAAAAAGSPGGALDGFRASGSSSSGRASPIPVPPRQSSAAADPGFSIDPATGQPKTPRPGLPSDPRASRREAADAPGSRRRGGGTDDAGSNYPRGARPPGSGGASSSASKLPRSPGEASEQVARGRSTPPPPIPVTALSDAAALGGVGANIPIPPIPPSPPRGDMYNFSPGGHLTPNANASSSLEALRKTDTLQRRASKRFSHYTYSKIAATSSPHKRGDASLGIGLGGGGGLPGSPSPGLGGASGSIGKSGGRIFGADEDRQKDAKETGDAGRELVRGAKSARRPSWSSKELPQPDAEKPSEPPPIPVLNGEVVDRKGGVGEDTSAVLAALRSAGSSPGASSSDLPSAKRPSIIPEEAEDIGSSSPDASLANQALAAAAVITMTKSSSAPSMLVRASPGAEEKALPLPAIVRTSVQDYGPPPSTPPPPAHPIIFLQLGREVKKAVLESPPTIASLRILFMERFQYSPGSEDFPVIYVRDTASGVQYELEDMSEVRDRVVLSLNIDALDQVKTHIDTGLASLARELKDLKSSITTMRRQSVSLHVPQHAVFGDAGAAGSPSTRPSDHRFPQAARAALRAAKPTPPSRPVSLIGSPKAMAAAPVLSMPSSEPTECAPLAPTPVAPASAPASAADFRATPQMVDTLKARFDEVQSLRRELGIVRQVYSAFSGDTKDMLEALRGQTEQIKAAAATQIAAPRAFIDAGKAKLEARSQDVVTRIEALQDTVEDLKQDVTNRKVRPKPALMNGVSDVLKSVAAELEELSQHIATIKPAWKKSWEDELQNIVDEQQLLNYQEDLLKDLKEDWHAVSDLFGHVKDYIDARKATKVRAKEYVPPPPTVGGPKEGLSTVLMQVKALQPNPEARLKAIEAAERSRQRALESGIGDDAFAEELAGFVGGKKLKLTGGHEEVERIRKLKSEATLRNMLGGGGGGGGTPAVAVPGAPAAVQPAPPPAPPSPPVPAEPATGDADGDAPQPDAAKGAPAEEVANADEKPADAA